MLRTFPEVYLALERNMIPTKQTPWVEALTGPEYTGESSGASPLSLVLSDRASVRGVSP